MARGGRPKLPGKRKNGRRVLTQWDHGTEKLQALRARFARFHNGKASQQVCDPIGRAWAVGLLENDRIDPAVLRDAGRNYAARYWSHYPSPNGVSNYEKDCRAPSRSEADPLGAKFKVLDDNLARSGRDAGQATQSLCLDNHWFPDANPAWLDRLIEDRMDKGSRHTLSDARQMKLAIEGLMALAGEKERIAA